MFNVPIVNLEGFSVHNKDSTTLIVKLNTSLLG